MKCEVPDAYNFPHSIDVTRINRPYINNMLGASRDRRDILSFIQHVSESVSKTYRGDGTQCHASKSTACIIRQLKAENHNASSLMFIL